ncbi:MAG: hypothetical protein LBL02_02940 [Endomicrobium sp.]|nr:hypothetical protein [Endomicrobium sp.]
MIGIKDLYLKRLWNILSVENEIVMTIESIEKKYRELKIDIEKSIEQI